MIIIDGVIQMQDDPTINARGIAGNPLDINPDLIESIEVVRGAAAAAIYGQKAANGVINITTKRGADLPAGTTRLNVENITGISQLKKSLPQASHHRFLVNEDNQFVDTFGRLITDRNFVNDPNSIMDNAWGVPTYNNYKAIFGTGLTLSSNASLQQSSLATNFSIAAGASHESGVVQTPEADLGRQNISMNLDHRAGSMLTGSLGLFYNRQFQRFIANGNNIFTAVQDIQRDIDITRIDPATGDYVPFPDGTNQNRFNPLYFEPKRDTWEKRIGVQANASVNFRPTSILSFSATGGYLRSDREGQQQYTPAGTLTTNGGADAGQYDISADLDETFNMNSAISVLTGMGGFTVRGRLMYTGQVERRHGWAVRGDSLFQSGPDLDFTRRFDADETKRDIRNVGVTTNIAFDYNAKYTADLVYRRDGNSLLPPSSRWKGNGRASFAWQMNEEPWWPLSNITLMKPRYSIGTAGNNPVFNARYETYLRNAGTDRVFKQNMGNTNIEPEEVTEQEFGLDMAYKNKYSASLTYVRNVVKNSIRADTISSYTGFDTQQANLGDLGGTSYEATFESQWVQQRNFRWSTTLVLDRSRQKITSYPRLCQPINVTNTLERHCAGFVFGQMYGDRLVRNESQLNPKHITSGSADWNFDLNDDGLLVAVDSGGSWTDMQWGRSVSIDGVSYAWGMPIRVGVYDVDGTRTGNRVDVIGDGLSDFNFGLGNQIQVGKWTGHIQFAGQIGGLIFNREAMTRYDLEIHSDLDQAGKPDYAKKPINYYTDNDNTASGAGGVTADDDNSVDWFLEDGSYLRLSELRIAYRLDGGLPLLRRLGMTGGQIALIGRNLLTLTDYSGIDPQVGATDDATTARVDQTSYPRSRNYALQIRFIF
jgi:TonB-dependent SusC/RagA subfamily outer membrane receptor